MKQGIKKFLSILFAIIIIIGIVMIFTKGLVFELKYQDNKKIEMNLEKEFNKKDIKEITKEVFGNQPVSIQAIEVYKDAVSITTTEITEEQKENLINKINEKYETELEKENVQIEQISHIRGRDLIKPYVIPMIITNIIILIYIMIKYRKINSIKTAIKYILFTLETQILYLSILAIARIPVGEYVLAIALMIYMLSAYICMRVFENDLQKIKENEE